MRSETIEVSSHLSPLTSYIGGKWSLLVDRPRPGWENMAVDAALLDWTLATGQAFLRCYQWDPYCLSFGRHEPALRRYDVARIRAEGLSCVRRPTGGRAVWHAGELTYAVTAPIAAFGGMREAYAAIHGLLAAAIGALGAKAFLAPRSSATPGLASGPCFATPVGGEVLVQGRKVAGSAQLRSGEAFLQHGSLLLATDQDLVRVLAGLPPQSTAEASLESLLGHRVTFGDAAAALASAAEPLFEELDQVSGLPASVEAGATAHAERFRSEAWTWQR